MAFRGRRRRRRSRRRLVRRRRTRTPCPGRPITNVRLSSNPRPVREARDVGHRRTVGLESLIDLTGVAPDGTYNITYQNLLDAMAPSARTADTVVMVRWIYAWSGIPGGGVLHGYLHQPNCMQLTSTVGAAADGTIAQRDSGSGNSMARIGFKIPWAARYPRLMDATTRTLIVAYFTHYGPIQTDAAKTKYNIYIRAGITFWQ